MVTALESLFSGAYAIDCLAAGQDLDHQTIAKYLDICEDSFEPIKGEIISNNDKKLGFLRDNLRETFSYKQIRFVLACPFYIYFPFVLSFSLLRTLLNAEVFWYCSYLNFTRINNYPFFHTSLLF